MLSSAAFLSHHSALRCINSRQSPNNARPVCVVLSQRQRRTLCLWHPHPRHNSTVDCVWNVMAHAQKPDFFFRRNGRVHLNRRGPQFSRLLAAEVCASAVVLLDKPCSEVVWRVLATHSILQFPLHFPSRASTCAITFQLDCISERLFRKGGTATSPHTTLGHSFLHYSDYCGVLVA